MDIKDNTENIKELLTIRSAILEAIPHAVIGLRNRIIVFANDGVYRVFGWKPKEIIGNSMRPFFHNDKEFEREGQRFYSIMEKRKRHKLIFTFVRKDGSDVICMDSAVRIGNNFQEKKIVVTHTDITKLKETEAKLKKSQRELQKHVYHLQDAIENERKRIARDIHDEIGQILTVLKMDLWWIEKKNYKDDSLIDKISSMSTLIDKAIHSVQRISSDLRPALLDELGLIDVLEWYTDNFHDCTGINCEFVSNIDRSDSLNDKLSITIFRVIQESLTNVTRHALATDAKVYLFAKGKKINLIVKDNGKGIEPSRLYDPNSFGILCINERIKLLGGIVRIHGIKDKGTTIIAKIPKPTRR